MSGNEKMQLKCSQSTLKRTYYRSFMLLVVIPLVLVFVGAEFAVGYIVRNSAVETIGALQDTVSATLSSDVRTNALQLSHFVHINDGEFTQTAAQVYRSRGNDWYEADQRLQQAFRTAVVPSQDILVGAFYMNGGTGVVYMKDDVTIPEEQIRQSDWYQAALAQRNTVKLGCYDTDRTRVIRTSRQAGQMVLVTAMAVNAATDRSGEIEAVAFFTRSEVSSILDAQNKDKLGSRSVILDQTGHVLFGDMGDELVRTYFEQRLGIFVPGQMTRRALLAEEGEHDYFFQTRKIPDTDWFIVTFVEESNLGSGFYKVGSVLALIVVVLLILFYFYSRYFLNAIIDPIHAVCQGMARLDRSDLDVQVEPTGQREIRELTVSFNQMVLSIKNMLRLTEETMEKKHHAEIQALQSQIDPHFVVNTLNSIRFMAQVAQFDGIRKMAEALVSIVSCSFRSKVGFYTVGEELEMLKTYVYLMRIRYSNGFDVDYDVQSDCLDYLLPRLTLQPVVENSIVHGFDELTDELGQVKISIYSERDTLCLSVWDNGRGMTQEQINLILWGRFRERDDNTSIGLENVQARMKLNFSEAARMEIDSQIGKFTQVTLRLPISICCRGKKMEEKHDTDCDRRR